MKRDPILCFTAAVFATVVMACGGGDSSTTAAASGDTDLTEDGGGEMSSSSTSGGTSTTGGASTSTSGSTGSEESSGGTSETPTCEELPGLVEAYKTAHPGNGGKDWDFNTKTPAELANDPEARRLLSLCGEDQRPIIPSLAWEYGGADHQWINPDASALF